MRCIRKIKNEYMAKIMQNYNLTIILHSTLLNSVIKNKYFLQKTYKK